ncbi:MAG: RagB/SusD family nutrient uptake outer membrane protein [Bacteroidales bacterium]
MKKILLILLFSSFLLSSCDDLFEPAVENFKNVEQMYDDPIYAQGFLMFTYRSIPSVYDNSEYGTDDAVTNDRGNNYLQAATGTWTSANSPINLWTSAYGAIQSLNIFIANCDQVTWAEDEEANLLFKVRMKGEAYGLRGMYFYYLMRNHAGFAANGDLLGVIILDQFMDSEADFNIPRSPFDVCIEQIYNDLDSAQFLLPNVYENVSSYEEVPERFHKYVTRYEVYNRVMGEYSRQLFNGQIAKAFKSKTSLLAASPAFQHSSNSATWEDAAVYAKEVLDYVGGISGLAANGMSYFTNTAEIDNLQDGIDPAEILWRQNVSPTNSDQESANFPPSLFGTGRMNPTQNLVEAFPMVNGYPIDDANSGYNPEDPFEGRDPRLPLCIIYNGSTAGVNSTPIYTGTSSGTDDGININDNTTRTGYYMKKRLRMDVNLDPIASQGKPHYIPRVRYTEIFLNYAEAANEAYGPYGVVPGSAYSAYDVIKAIRARALGVNDDPYLEECAGDQVRMRELIRNERRLELCFEGFRFWDLRRWSADINEIAKGYDASTGEIFDVEERSFKDYMHYGPIPFSEILKYDNLIQNEGWN